MSKSKARGILDQILREARAEAAARGPLDELFGTQPAKQQSLGDRFSALAIEARELRLRLGSGS